MTGRVVVVTGASGGVGRAVAYDFGAKGDRVGLLARGELGLDGAVKDVEHAGGRALAVPTDVADHRQVEAAAEQVERTLGPIDIWVNVAFTSVFAPFIQIDPDEYRRVTEVTYLGYVYGTRAALERMLPRDHGTIVQVGSTLAYRGIPLQSAYCGAKHAIQGFHEALPCELLHDRRQVRVTMVQLPAVNTPQFDWVLNRLPNHPQPVPPIYQPEVVARAILYAAEHPRRREYWVGGSTVGTLLGDNFAPGLLDRYLARTGYKASRASSLPIPTRPSICGARSTGRVAVTSAPTAASMRKRSTAAPRCGFRNAMACWRPSGGPRGSGRAAAVAPIASMLPGTRSKDRTTSAVVFVVPALPAPAVDIAPGRQGRAHNWGNCLRCHGRPVPISLVADLWLWTWTRRAARRLRRWLPTWRRGAGRRGTRGRAAAGRGDAHPTDRGLMTLPPLVRPAASRAAHRQCAGPAPGQLKQASQLAVEGG